MARSLLVQSKLGELIAWLHMLAEEGGPPKKPDYVANDFPSIAQKLKEIEKEKEKAREKSQAS